MIKQIRKKLGRQRHRLSTSFFSDQVIEEFSTAHCECDLLLLEPTLTYDEAGKVKKIGQSIKGETVTQSKHCTVHLCELQGVDPEFFINIQDTAQLNEICLSVILNHVKKGSLQYEQIDNKFHECKQKVGEKWRTFRLKFSVDDKDQFEDFQSSIKTALKIIQEAEKCKQIYLLLAVQEKLNRGRRSVDSKEDPDIILRRFSISGEAECASLEDAPIGDENEDIPIEYYDADLPPFEPAPYDPGFEEKEQNNLNSEDCDKTVSGIQSVRVVPKITTTTESLNNYFDGEETPQTFDSILRSAEKDDNPVSENTKNQLTVPEGINKDYESIRNPWIDSNASGIYMQMGVLSGEKKMAGKTATTPNEERVLNIAKLLQTAINERDVRKAQEYAQQLASEDVIVTIEAKVKALEDKEFNLKVYIEDKESSGLSIMLKVRSSDTILDLKNKMLIKNMFPVEVQRWIIGKRLPANNETLADCRIKSEGHSAFLYLVTAKSAGLNKEEYMRRQAFLNPDYVQILNPNVPVVPANIPESIPVPVPAKMPSPGSANRKQEPKVADVNLVRTSGPDPKKGHDKPIHSVMPEKAAVGRIKPQQADDDIRNLVDHLTLSDMYPVQGKHMPLTRSRREPVQSEEELPAPTGWRCSACTYINQPTRPGCEVCTNPRPADYEIPSGYILSDAEKKRIQMEELLERQTREAEEQQRRRQRMESEQNFRLMQQTDAQDIIPNNEEFTCPICFEDIPPGEGVVLRECLHAFCRECLRDSVIHNEEPVLRCPYQDDNYSCDGTVTDREIKAVVTKEIYDKYLSRSLTTAESQARNSFHCKTADCPGWCLYEDQVNFFVCPVCRKENCLTCKAIHEGMNCKQYQEDLKIRAINDGAAKQTQIMIRRMLDEGDAMSCPQCQVVVMKKEGCDWIQCSICKTEICWVTKGPRWGPDGPGDISGGCRCRVNGQMCHPDCNNCH